MTTKKPGCGCLSTITILSALLIAGGYSFSKGWHQFFWGTELTPLEAATIIPKEVFITSYIDTKPENWSQLKKLHVPEIEAFVNSLTADINQDYIQTDWQINYQEEISPWLGNLAIAFFPKLTPSFSSTYGFKPDADLLMIFGIRNPLKAYHFRQKLKSQANLKYDESIYQGIKITAINRSLESKIYFAVLRNKLVVADKLKILHKAIATYQGEPALASISESKRAFKQKANLKNSLVQVYLTNYNHLLDEPLIVDSVVLGIGNDSKKIELKTIANFNQKIAKNTDKINKQLIIDNFPESTIAIAGSQFDGQRINQAWSYFIEDWYPYLSLILANKANSTQWLAEISKYLEFMKLIEGEFSLGIATSKESISTDSAINLDAGLLLEIRDRHQGELALKQLLNKPLLAPLKQRVNDEFSIQSSIPSFNLNFSSIWLEQNNLLLAWGENKDDLIFPHPNNSLQNNKKIMSFFRKLPDKNIGYFYLDVATLTA